jgi:hypothetical protein
MTAYIFAHNTRIPEQSVMPAKPVFFERKIPDKPE